MVYPDPNPSGAYWKKRSLQTVATIGWINFFGLAGAAARSLLPAVDTFTSGDITIDVSPVQQMSVVMRTPAGIIYTDPTGGARRYAGYPEPDIILVSHEHSEHFDAATLLEVSTRDTKIIVPPFVFEQLPERLHSNAVSLANGQSIALGSFNVEAIPSYGLSGEAQEWHPRGRGNGYVVTVANRRLYIAGSSQAVPEMLQLQDIYLALLPLYPPYALAPEDAVRAVASFQPDFTYIYQYNSTQTRDSFLRLSATSGQQTIVAPDISP